MHAEPISPARRAGRSAPSVAATLARGLLLAACIAPLGALVLTGAWAGLAHSGGGNRGEAAMWVMGLVVGATLLLAPGWYAVTGARTRFWTAWSASRGWTTWQLGVYDLPAEDAFTAPGARTVHHAVRGTIVGRDAVLCEVECGHRWTLGVLLPETNALIASRVGRADHAQALDTLCDEAAAALTTAG